MNMRTNLGLAALVAFLFSASAGFADDMTDKSMSEESMMNEETMASDCAEMDGEMAASNPDCDKDMGDQMKGDAMMQDDMADEGMDGTMTEKSD